MEENNNWVTDEIQSDIDNLTEEETKMYELLRATIKSNQEEKSLS